MKLDNRSRFVAGYVFYYQHENPSHQPGGIYVIRPPIFSHSAHFVLPKTFSRNQTPQKTHLVQLKTFLRNKIVSGRRARLRLSAFLPGTWLMLHHRTRRIQAAGHRHRVLREGHEKGYRLRSYQIQGHPGRAAGGLPESLRPV